MATMGSMGPWGQWGPWGHGAPWGPGGRPAGGNHDLLLKTIYFLVSRRAVFLHLILLPPRFESKPERNSESTYYNRATFIYGIPILIERPLYTVYIYIYIYIFICMYRSNLCGQRKRCNHMQLIHCIHRSYKFHIYLLLCGPQVESNLKF